MNVFKALEVFKRIPKLSPSLNPLRAVRGLWVSGEHRDPMTQDSVVHINEVDSNQAEVRIYTETSEEINSDILYTLSGFGLSEFTYVDYTTANVDMDQEISYVNVTNVYNPTLTFVPYIITNIDVDQEISYVNVTNIYAPDFSFIPNYTDKQYSSTQPEPTLYISEFTSNDVEID